MRCRFWLAVQDLKRMPQEDVAQRVQDIWAEFLAEGATSSINLDSHSYERTSQNLKDPGRYSYEDAQVSEREAQEQQIFSLHRLLMYVCAITMILKDSTVKSTETPALTSPILMKHFGYIEDRVTQISLKTPLPLSPNSRNTVAISTSDTHF